MSDLVDEIHAIVNEVEDPCSIAQGIPTGLVDMGLLNDVDVTTTDGRTRVELELRLTGPGCLYSVHFEREIAERLERKLGVEDVEIRWSPIYDWTQSDIAPHVQQQLRERRERLLAAAGREDALPIVSTGTRRPR